MSLCLKIYVSKGFLADHTAVDAIILSIDNYCYCALIRNLSGQMMWGRAGGWTWYAGM